MFTGIAMAYTILLLNLLLLAGLGLVVIFLTGIASYMLLIVICGLAMAGLSGYIFFRRLRKEGRSLGDTLRSPDFQGRELEVSLFGGMATPSAVAADRQDVNMHRPVKPFGPLPDAAGQASARNWVSGVSPGTGAGAPHIFSRL